MMQLSDQGEALIKSFEGLRLSAYRDSAGVWTIGYGSTRNYDGKTIKPGDKLASQAQADALLRNTLNTYVDAVYQRTKVPLTQNQFDALVSFVYNTGAAGGKTLFEKLNARDYAGAADQFLLWNKITDPHTGNKIVCDTLVKRRAAERNLFLKP
jgi:lysozyme